MAVRTTVVRARIRTEGDSRRSVTTSPLIRRASPVDHAAALPLCSTDSSRTRTRDEGPSRSVLVALTSLQDFRHCECSG